MLYPMCIYITRVLTPPRQPSRCYITPCKRDPEGSWNPTPAVSFQLISVMTVVQCTHRLHIAAIIKKLPPPNQIIITRPLVKILLEDHYSTLSAGWL